MHNANKCTGALIRLLANIKRNVMSKISLIGALALITVSSYGQTTKIPDSNFEQALIDLKFDNVVDGKVVTSNINKITRLDLNRKNISDLTGIQDFTALESLRFKQNQVVSLDISQNKALKFLNCPGNLLSSLDVSQNKDIEELRLNGNKLSTLDVSHNLKLTTLRLDGNQLTSLDVSHNLNLSMLRVNANNLKLIDVTKNTKLKELSISDNQISSLNILNNKELFSLYCIGNNLKSLDVSHLNALETLWCSENNLEMLKVTGSERELRALKNPNLNCISISNSWALETRLKSMHSQAQKMDPREDAVEAGWQIDSTTTLSANCP